MMFITLLMDFSLYAMQHTLDIGQRNDLAQSVVTSAVDEWTQSRRCRVDPETHSRMSEHITTSLPAMKAKEELGQRVARARIFALLDDVSVSHGPRSEECFVTGEGIEDRSFEMAWFPRTGVLEVEGSVANAPVYIDGKLKGSLPYATVLHVGKHTWRTMKCQESIEIKKDETRQVRCDRH